MVYNTRNWTNNHMIMTSSIVDSPPSPHNIILRKNCPTKSNADFVWTVEEHLIEKRLTPWKAQIVLGGGNILDTIALSYPPRVRVRAMVKLSVAFFHDESSITIGGIQKCNSAEITKAGHQLSESYFIKISYVLTELLIFFYLQWCFFCHKSVVISS